jgi:hypothetical protein
MSGVTRRSFLEGIGMTVAAAVALALTRGTHAVALPPALASLYPQGDWHVDDIVGHLPRYAHPIPFMHDTAAPDLAAQAAPVDRQFLS